MASRSWHCSHGAPQVPEAVTEPAVPAATPPGGFGCNVPGGAFPNVPTTFTVVCSPTVTTVDGGTLIVTVTAPPAPGVTVQITTAPNAIGDPNAPCFLQTALPAPAAPGGNASVTYQCAVGASFPVPELTNPLPQGCAAQPSAPADSNICLTVVSSDGIASAIVTDNANGPLSPPASQTPFPELLNQGPCGSTAGIAGVWAPSSAAQNSTIDCPVSAFGGAASAQAGETLALQITAANAQTIFVQGPCTNTVPSTTAPCTFTCRRGRWRLLSDHCTTDRSDAAIGESDT